MNRQAVVRIARVLAPLVVLATAVIVLTFLAFGDGGAKPPERESSHPFLIGLPGHAVDKWSFLEVTLAFCAMALILAPVPLVALFAVRRMRRSRLLVSEPDAAHVGARDATPT